MTISIRAATWAAALSAAFLISCSSDESSTDTGTANDAAAGDTGMANDTGAVDTGAVDTGVVDTGVVDTGVVDAGADTGVVDTGMADTGMVDMGMADTGVVDTGMMAPFELTSTAFNPGDMIPLRYECSREIGNGPGENVSPQLSWTAGPVGTMSYAIIMDDTDFNDFVHWVIYDIPLATQDIAEDVPAGYEPAFPAGAKQAEIQNSGYFGYFGPCSPGRINTYRWTIYAIPTATLMGATQQTSETAAAQLIMQQGIAMASFTGES